MLVGVAVVWAWQLAPSLQQMICPYCDPNYGEGQHADKTSVRAPREVNTESFLSTPPQIVFHIVGFHGVNSLHSLCNIFSGHPRPDRGVPRLRRARGQPAP